MACELFVRDLSVSLSAERLWPRNTGRLSVRRSPRPHTPQPPSSRGEPTQLRPRVTEGTIKGALQQVRGDQWRNPPITVAHLILARSDSASRADPAATETDHQARSYYQRVRAVARSQPLNNGRTPLSAFRFFASRWRFLVHLRRPLIRDIPVGSAFTPSVQLPGARQGRVPSPPWSGRRDLDPLGVEPPRHAPGFPGPCHSPMPDHETAP